MNKVAVILAAAAVGTLSAAGAVYQKNVSETKSRHLCDVSPYEVSADNVSRCTYYYTPENENNRIYCLGIPDIDSIPWRCNFSSVNTRDFARDEYGNCTEVNAPAFEIKCGGGFDFGEVPEKYSFNVQPRREDGRVAPISAQYVLSPDGELLNSSELSYDAKKMFDEVQPELLTILDEVQTAFSFR